MDRQGQDRQGQTDRPVIVPIYDDNICIDRQLDRQTDRQRQTARDTQVSPRLELHSAKAIRTSDALLGGIQSSTPCTNTTGMPLFCRNAIALQALASYKVQQTNLNESKINRKHLLSQRYNKTIAHLLVLIDDTACNLNHSERTTSLAVLLEMSHPIASFVREGTGLKTNNTRHYTRVHVRGRGSRLLTSMRKCRTPVSPLLAALLIDL